MTKIIVVVFSILLILGCGDSKKAEERKAEQVKEKIRAYQFKKNIMREGVLLLAIKYEISEDQLMEIIIDYEKMIQGFSVTEVLKGFTDKDGPKDRPKVSMQGELVDVSTALNRISEKYGISKKTLSTIILERKMLEVRSKD